ncbi:hypothetical protein L228DRAFT_238822 [Xylona heveae TC161]|uniref:Fucose-specific lectin n=1 Tax=Xylona heveae (strain CBS 132557 / TC161) TaxID=1328760 RepID=A0A165H387_XYLHT|nr:hypothetical protein L228DRAFT_238822 [Xylona heveae TC161]KZF22925.1 hypothetical protein L228DRAFT_238822 [Xylona heveae TC161]
MRIFGKDSKPLPPSSESTPAPSRDSTTNWFEGLEVVPVGHGIEAVPVHPGVEVVPSEHLPSTPLLQLRLGEAGKEVIHQEVLEPEPDTRRRRLKWWILAVTVLIVLIAVGVVLGIVLSRKHPSSKANSQSPTASTVTQAATPTHSSNKSASASSTATITPTPTIFSHDGAFNGSGFTVLDLGDSDVGIDLFYQHYTGEIRNLILQNNASAGQDAEIVVPSNARNGTSLTAISYNKNNTLTWHVFYIDTNNIVQEATRNSSSKIYITGPVGKLKAVAAEGPSVGLMVCYNDDYYGTSPSSSSSSSSSISGAGLRLFYGSSATTIQELEWGYGTTDWKEGNTFHNANGQGGVACAGVGSGITYLYAATPTTDIDGGNQIQMWWKDFNVNATANTTSHPTGIWNAGPATSYALRPNTSLSNSNFVYFQDASGYIVGLKSNAQAESSSWGDNFFVGDNLKALPGTQITSTTSYPSGDTPSTLHVFFQLNGDDVHEYNRPTAGGSWSWSVLQGV